MATSPAIIRRLLAADSPSEVPDAQLVARFAGNRDEAAFAELARRHGGMVVSVARRTVRDHHLADDVAQAVFLVLARKAGRLARPDRLAGWLFGVTRRLARKSATRQRRDAGRTRPLTDRIAACEESPAWDDMLRLLDEALARLPEAERVPLVLCYLEGLTQDEAARACGWSVRTLRRRLASGRQRLRQRLEGRGIEVGSLLAALAVGTTADAIGPGRLIPLVPSLNPGSRSAVLAQAELRSAGWVTSARWVASVAAVGLTIAIAVVVVAGTQSDPPAAKPRPPAASAESDLPDGALVRLGSAALRHPDNLTHLRFTADGTQLISYGHGKARWWDAKTGAAVRHPAKDIATTFGTTLLSPDASKVIAPHVEYNPLRYSVREYDLATGEHTELFVIPPRKGPDGKEAGIGLQRFALSPDGTLLVEGWQHEAYLWDLKTRKVRHQIRLPGAANFHFQFTPDGNQLMTAGGDDRAVRFWNLSTGKEDRVLNRTGPWKSGVTRLALSGDGRWIAVVDSTHLLGTGTQMAIWDLTMPARPQVITLADGFGLSAAVAFGPGGVVYVVSSASEERFPPVLTKWDGATGKQLARWTGPHGGRYGPVTAVVSPDGNTLAVGNYWGVIRLYDTRTGAEIVRPPVLSSEVIGVKFDRAGGEVQTVAADGSAATWEGATGKLRTRRGSPVPLPAAGERTSVVPSPDGHWIVTYSLNPADGRPPWLAVLWDTATGARKHTFGLEGRVKEVTPVPGGKLLIAVVEGQPGPEGQVWDVATGEATSWGYQLSQRSRYAFFPDGKTIVVMDEERATGYELATGQTRFSWKLAEHNVLGRPSPKENRRPELIRAVAASPDGKTLAISIGGEAFIDVSKRTYNLVVVEAETGKVIRRVLTPETSARLLVFSPDGKRLAGPYCVWDVATLKEVRRFPSRPEVTALAFSPDGQRIATGHANGTALVWALGAE